MARARAKGHHIPVQPGDKAPVKGLEVAVVTAGPVNKVGTVDAQLVTRHAQAMTTELGNTPGMDLWQTEKITAGGEAGLNGPDDHIANIGGEPSAQVPFLKLAANPDGSFQMTNSRNGFSKDYAAHK